MKNKGQALIEFIIILPVLIMILMSIIDFGNIIYKKYNLENHLDYVVRLYQDDKKDLINSYANKNNFSVTKEENNNTTTITIKEKIKINTPVLSNILKSPYTISASRDVYEKE